MNGLSPWLKLEVDVLELRGLVQMMKLALKIENRERSGGNVCCVAFSEGSISSKILG